jgi:hypothetical protein
MRTLRSSSRMMRLFWFSQAVLISATDGSQIWLPVMPVRGSQT